MKKLAIIPARGGSKRIPKKNMKHFLGKPIISYTLDVLKESNLFDEIMVSTDDQSIADYAASCNVSVPVLRSSANSDDFATLADVIFEVLDYYFHEGRPFDLCCVALATAPFISTKQLFQAVSSLEKENIDSVCTVAEFDYPIQRALYLDEKNCLVWANDEFQSSRSQDLIPSYHDAGQFYIFKTEAFKMEKRFIMKNTKPIILSNLDYQDIDTIQDWVIAEHKFALQNGIN